MSGTYNSANSVHVYDVLWGGTSSPNTWTVKCVSDNISSTLGSVTPGSKWTREELDKILEDWDRYNRLDEQQKHMVRPPPSLDGLVANRLAGDKRETYLPVWQITSTWAVLDDFKKGANLYAKLRHSSTKRHFELEMATRRAQEMRSEFHIRLGNRRGGFKFSKAYSPKRSWMQGRPRR